MIFGHDSVLGALRFSNSTASENHEISEPVGGVTVTIFQSVNALTRKLIFENLILRKLTFGFAENLEEINFS